MPWDGCTCSPCACGAHGGARHAAHGATRWMRPRPPLMATMKSSSSLSSSSELDSVVRRRARPARPGGPAAAYGRHAWGRARPCAPALPSTDALDSFFTLRVASLFPARRVPTAKALAEPLLDCFSSVASRSRSWRDFSRPLQALLQPSLGSIVFRPKTPRFRRFR